MLVSMYEKFFIVIAVIAFAATTTTNAVTAAFGQDQTSNFTTLSAPSGNNTMTIANNTGTTTTTTPNMTLDDAREQYLSTPSVPLSSRSPPPAMAYMKSVAAMYLHQAKQLCSM
jgi:hypothetical protein